MQTKKDLKDKVAVVGLEQDVYLGKGIRACRPTKLPLMDAPRGVKTGSVRWQSQGLNKSYIRTRVFGH